MLDQILENPLEFIENLAQEENEEPDFGLNKLLNQYFKENPQDIHKIPLVCNLEDMQATFPGSLVRLRCSLAYSNETEYFPYRFLYQGKYKSCLLNEEMPEDAPQDDLECLRKRYLYTAISIRPMTDWFLKESSTRVSHRKSTTTSKKSSNETIRNTPFDVIIKTAIEFKIRSTFDTVDVIGVFSNADDSFELLDGMAKRQLPTFLGLSFLETHCNSFNEQLQDISEIRKHILDILSTVLEPNQSKILLLWLLSSFTHSVGGTQLGSFSLNFSGANPEHVAQIVKIIENSVPLMKIINVSQEDLSKSNFVVEITDNGIFGDLKASSGTRFVINETELHEGEFSQKGARNIMVLKEMIEEQQIPFVYHDLINEPYSNQSCFRYIDFSSTKSLFKFDYSTQIGETPEFVEIPEDQFIVIRKYLEYQTNLPKAEFNAEEEKFIREKLTQKISEQKLTQERAQLMFLFFLLNMNSYGRKASIDNVWNETIEIFFSNQA